MAKVMDGSGKVLSSRPQRVDFILWAGAISWVTSWTMDLGRGLGWKEAAWPMIASKQLPSST